MLTLFSVKCKIIKIYLEDVYDIFYHKWFVYISIVHTIRISLYFFITLFKFYKNVCKKICTNLDLFFLSVDINSNHNVILYFFITLLILYW
jgi:hypothetical protein